MKFRLNKRTAIITAGLASLVLTAKTHAPSFEEKSSAYSYSITQNNQDYIINFPAKPSTTFRISNPLYNLVRAAGLSDDILQTAGSIKEIYKILEIVDQNKDGRLTFTELKNANLKKELRQEISRTAYEIGWPKESK